MRVFFRVLCFVIIGLLFFSCSSNPPPQPYNGGYNTGGGSGIYNTGSQQGAYNTGSQPGAYNTGSQPGAYNTGSQPGAYNTGGARVAPSSNDTPFQPGYESYMQEKVDNFLVILDASGSKFLPYNAQIKLKIAKDIVRRLNQKTPNRHLVGGLRRYGFEAGAWSVHTALIYGVANYSRDAFASAIEIVRWAGGKSPLSLAIDKASDDLQSTVGNIALIIVSDGKIYEGDPIDAAHRIKGKYGDRICIYTAQVGNLPWGWDILDKVAKAGGCGYATTSDCLADDKNMTDWADDIFNRGHKMKCRPEPPPPPPAPVEPPPSRERAAEMPPAAPGPCPDEDGDGVCDDRDRCPGTPKGARVDENGCWIIDKVQFDLDRYTIKPEYFSVIDEVIRVMKLNPGLKMKIEGHTCIIASEQYNMKLSHNRAIAVLDYMLKQGIESERLSVEGFAFHKPTASNKSREGRIANRRAEFVQLNFEHR